MHRLPQFILHGSRISDRTRQLTMFLMVLRDSAVRLELYLNHSMGKYHVSLIFLMPIVIIF